MQCCYKRKFLIPLFLYSVIPPRFTSSYRPCLLKHLSGNLALAAAVAPPALGYEDQTF